MIHRFFLCLMAVALMGCFALPVHADSNRADQFKSFLEETPPEERARMQTEQLAQFLELSPEQTEQVQALNLGQAKQTQEIMASGDARFKKFKAVKALRADKDKRLSQILTPEQWQAYQKKKSELQQQFKQHLKERNNS